MCSKTTVGHDFQILELLFCFNMCFNVLTINPRVTPRANPCSLILYWFCWNASRNWFLNVSDDVRRSWNKSKFVIFKLSIFCRRTLFVMMSVPWRGQNVTRYWCCNVFYINASLQLLWKLLEWFVFFDFAVFYCIKCMISVHVPFHLFIYIYIYIYIFYRFHEN